MVTRKSYLFDKNPSIFYNFDMKKFLTILFLILGMIQCFASEELSKQATAFYSDNNYDKTMELLLLINEKERSPQDWLLLGNLLDEKGEKEQAIFMYQKAAEVDTKYYKPYYNIANIYMEQSRYNMAVENYKKAAKYNPANAYVYYNLACAYLKQGKTRDAKNALIKAVTIKNDIPEVHYNLAYVYKKLNKPKLAKTYLDNYNKLMDKEQSL